MDGLKNEDRVLCTASGYKKLYYFNEDTYGNLPKPVKDELKAMCVLFTEDVGGVILLMFDDDGSLEIITEAEDNDYGYDEIGSALKIKDMRRDKRELFGQLEKYYDVFFRSGMI